MRRTFLEILGPTQATITYSPLFPSRIPVPWGGFQLLNVVRKFRGAMLQEVQGSQF